MAKRNKKTTLRNKADRLMQEVGRRKYQRCEACSGPMTCMHHYYTKSSCAALRYDWDNLIAICNGCHMQHHNGNPDIHNTVNEKRGKAWMDRLKKKRHTLTVKPGIKYYEAIIEELQEILEGYES